MVIIIGKIIAVVVEWLMFVFCSDLLLKLKRSKITVALLGIGLCAISVAVKCMNDTELLQVVVAFFLMFIYALIVIDSGVKVKLLFPVAYLMLSISMEGLIQEFIEVMKLEMPYLDEEYADVVNMLEILRYILAFYCMEMYLLIKKISKKEVCSSKKKQLEEVYYCGD